MDLEDGSHKTQIFGVFDGHGGAEVAQYSSQHLPGFMRQLTEYKEGDIEKALIQAFVSFDRHLLDEEVVETLKILAGQDNDTDDEKTKRDEAAQLREEANMDIQDLVAKYEREHPNSIPAHLKKGLNALSPMIRKKKDEAGPSSSGQSSSGSSSSAEVSSSKQEETPATKNGQHSKEEEKNGKGTENGSAEIKEENEAEGDISVKEDELKADAPQEAKKIDKGKKLVKKVIPPPSFEEPEEIEQSYEEFLKNGDSEEDDEDESGPDFVPGKLNYDLDDDDDDDSEDLEEEEEDSDSDEDSEEDSDDDEDEEDGMFATRTEGEFEEPGKDSGCTAVLAVLRGDDLFVANAGDSRCVVSQKGKAIDMSIDHKPEDEREQTRIEAAGGQVTPDGRVNGGLNLSRALGDHTYKTNDKLPLEEQMISPLPDVKKIHIDADFEFMVLACDGIWYVFLMIIIISILIVVFFLTGTQ